MKKIAEIFATPYFLLVCIAMNAYVVWDRWNIPDHYSGVVLNAMCFGLGIASIAWMTLLKLVRKIFNMELELIKLDLEKMRSDTLAEIDHVNELLELVQYRTHSAESTLDKS